MKIVAGLGILLVILAILGFISPDISFNKEKTVINVGPINAVVNEQTIIHIPYYISTIVLLMGLGIFSYGYFKYTKAKS